MNRGAWWMATILGCTTVACERAPDGALSDAVANASPYTARFVAFESWALRAYSVTNPNDQRALTETLFAPLRNDSAVYAAWFETKSPVARVLSLPADVPCPDARPWTSVRDATLGWVRVARFEKCPVDAPRGWRSHGPESPVCVMLARDEERDPRHQPHITMAFVER